MRTLPWVDEGKDRPQNPLKRKRTPKSDIQPPQPTEPEPEPSSDSDAIAILDSSGDHTIDAMIPGYDNDDAYIMVEHDLLEAAKQVTRHIHLEAYQKHATAPITGEIVRPTIGVAKRRPVVEVEEEDEGEGGGKDVSTLGELLRRRPTATLVAATPIKRKEKSPGRERVSKVDLRKVEEVRDVHRVDMGRERRASSERRRNVEMLKEETRAAEADDEDDEDDEDLARPLKVCIPFTPTNVTRLQNPPLIQYVLHRNRQVRLHGQQSKSLQALTLPPNRYRQNRRSIQIGSSIPSGMTKTVLQNLQNVLKSA